MKKFLSLFAAILFTGTLFSAGSYNLVQVTSVKDGGLYVFERNSRVLIGDVNDTKYKLQTTDTYSSENLTGTESYVWKLTGIASTDSFRIQSQWADIQEGGLIELTNKSGATDIALAKAGKGSIWKITFDGNGIALITTFNKGYKSTNRNRFLGEMAGGADEYRSYAESNLGSYGHDFTVYELQEQSTTDPFVKTNVAMIDFGTVVKDATVEPKEVKVTFGNLTGGILYSGISSPFSATGNITASGDKITISASSATVGEYSQTLLIEAEDDGVDASVTVKMKVVDAIEPIATGFVLYEAEELVEGDYILCHEDEYGFAALKAAVVSSRLDYLEVEPENDIITNPDAAIIWHLAKSGHYWTMFNAKENKYAAATDGKNKAQLLADGTDDKALWKVYIDKGYYDFENKARAAANTDSDKKWLRFNTTAEAFACYHEDIGDWLTLFKSSASATAVDNTAVESAAVKLIENGRLIIIKNGLKYDAFGTLVQ